MDRSPNGRYMPISAQPQGPEKTNLSLKQLERELSQHRQLITKKDEEIKYLNNKNGQIGEGKSMQGVKRSTDNIYESSLQEQIDRLTLKLNDKNKEYQRLYDKYSVMENDMATLQDFTTDLDRERKFLADKLANIEIHQEGDEVVGELENKLVLMSTEIMRLGHLTRNKTQENNQLRFKLKARDQEVEQIENQLSEKEKIIYQFREKLRALQKRQLQIQSSKQYQNESTYKILSLQIQRLNVVLHNKIQQIGTLEHKNRVLEDRLSLAANNVEQRNNYGQLEIEVQRLNKLNLAARRDIGDLEGQVKKLSRENKELGDQNDKFRRVAKKLEEELEETRKNYIKDQNEKIRIQVQTSQKIIRQQKSTIDKLQKQSAQHAQQRHQQMRQKFEQQTHNLKLMLQQSESKCNSLRGDLMRYEEKLVMLSQEVERLSLQNNKFQEENAELRKLQFRIEAKEREVREVERTRESAYVQIKRDKGQIDRLKAEIKDLWDKNRDLETKQYRLTSLTDEYQMLAQRLSTKQKQYKILNEKLIEQNNLRASGYALQNLQSQLESQRKSFRLKQQQLSYNYEKQCQDLKDTIAKLQIKVREMSSSQFSNQTNYALLADEIRRLNEVLSEYSQTIIKQKRQISLLESNLETAQGSLEKLKNSQYTNEKIEQQIQRRTQIYNKQLSLHQQETTNLRTKLQQLSTNCAILEQQVHNSRLNLQDAKQSLKNKELELRDVMEDMRSNKRNQDSLLMLIKEIKESNMRLERKLAEIQQDYIRRLEDKSMEKQQLQREYIEYNRKVRQAESQNVSLKFETSSLKNKIDVLSNQHQELETQNKRLRSRLDEELRDKSNTIKMSSEEYRSRMQEYELELKRNAKTIGEMEADNGNKTNQIYKLEGTVRQLEEERFRLQDQIRELEADKRRNIDLKNQESRMNLDQKQLQISNLRQQSTRLQLQLRQKSLTLDSKTRQITEYENKLAMLSQQLQRINAIVYNKNHELQEMAEKLSRTQQSVTRESKDAIEIFTIEITRLNTTLCQSLEQIKELQQEILNKNREIKRVMELGKKNQEVFKDKIFQLEQENERIMQENHRHAANTSIMARKIDDLQKMQKDKEEFNQKIVQFNTQKSKYKNTITDLQSQIQRLQNTYENNLQYEKNSLTSQASLRVGQLQEQKRQLERKITMLVSQNEQLVAQVQKIRRELEETDEQSRNNKRQLIRVQNQVVNLNREKEKYRLMNEEVLLKVEKMTFNRTVEQSNKENYEFQVKHLQGVVKEYENQMMAMKQEMERLSNRSKSRENSSVGSSNARLSSNNNSLGQGGELQQKYNILQSLHLKLKRQADGLRQKVTQYEFKIKKLKGQFDLINKLTHEYKDENQYLRLQNHSQCLYVGKSMQNQAVSMPSSSVQGQVDKNQDMLVKQTLASQIDRLGILNGNLRREVEDLRVQAVDGQSLKSRYEEMMAIFVLMAAELQSLRFTKVN